MNRIEVRKGDLFSAAGPNTILVHAVNCKGVWGSGIAVDFKKLYPNVFLDYASLCKRFHKTLLGMGIQYHRKDEQSVGYLFTSFDYGDNKDPEVDILEHTKSAVNCILSTLPSGIEVHSPKINSGRFNVPWEKTEEIINKRLRKYPDVKWIVWEKE